MKKTSVLVAIAITLLSCSNEPVLNRSEYKVVDTTYVAKNGFNAVLGYDVIVEIDSVYYAGSLNTNGELVYLNPRKLKINK